MQQETAVIVNLTDQSWALQRSYGVFTIHGCAPGEPYTLSRISPCKAVMDLGDKRTLDVQITAQEVAHDLCRQVNADGGEESYFGVFVAAAQMPTDAELEHGRALLNGFYRRLVAAADREWERSHSYLFINDIERRAAQHLGLEKEWFYRPRETAECPGCGEKIKPGVAVCKTCGAILDREKAAALGLGQPVAVGVGPTQSSQTASASPSAHAVCAPAGAPHAAPAASAPRPAAPMPSRR